MKCFLLSVFVDNPPIWKLPQLEMVDILIGKWSSQIKFTILWTTILWNMELNIKPLRSNCIKFRFGDGKGAAFIHLKPSVDHCQLSSQCVGQNWTCSFQYRHNECYLCLQGVLRGCTLETENYHSSRPVILSLWLYAMNLALVYIFLSESLEGKVAVIKDRLKRIPCPGPPVIL